MDPQVVDQVWVRAHSRCEYCHFPADFSEYPFHIDHILSRKHGGKSEPNNLALACFYCNTSKGPNIAGIDPQARALTALFNPREHNWAEHFKWEGAYLIGLTPIGRVTIFVLNINDPDAINLRRFLMSEDLYPA